MTAILLLLLLFPLAGRFLPRRACEAIACAGVLGALAMAVIAFIRGGGHHAHFTWFEWIRVGEFSATMDVYYDPLAAVMVLMVTFVSSLIHLYSVAFMRDDADYVRYFCYLNLFVFSMLVITLADNLLFVYLGWEGVGFCSYALIGFWYARVDFADAGRKAFIVTRIGDVAFGVALALFFFLFQSFSITFINAHAAGLSPALATALALLLLWAAAGKSAQLPLTVWLPDAMAGPTPVSALIHAATMVTAGVYLLMRLFPVVVLSPTAMMIIAGVGAVTTLYASCAALAQVDIKRVLAYSTISQVGYMILAVGAADIIGGMFHLLSHAFFKALATLAAGLTVIYTFRMFFTAFRERTGGRTPETVKPIPRLMVWVLWPLAILALSDGLLNLPGGPGKMVLANFFAAVPGARPDLGASPAVSWGLGLGGAALVLAALGLTYLLFRRPRPDIWGWAQDPLLSAFYLDRLYQRLIARPYQRLAGCLWQDVEAGGVDRGFEATAGGFRILSGFMGLWTTGRLSTYLFMLFFGLTVMFTVLAMSWNW